MGTLTVELPKTLEYELEARAQQEGVSLSQYVIYALTQNVTPIYTIQMLTTEIPERQKERFTALLKKLGAPDRAVASQVLAGREKEVIDDPMVAALIARVEAKFAEQ
ncbi:MAG: hypothetical protein R3E79_34740 [Caldilineaceae bacterium]